MHEVYKNLGDWQQAFGDNPNNPTNQTFEIKLPFTVRKSILKGALGLRIDFSRRDCGNHIAPIQNQYITDRVVGWALAWGATDEEIYHNLLYPLILCGIIDTGKD